MKTIKMGRVSEAKIESIKVAQGFRCRVTVYEYDRKLWSKWTDILRVSDDDALLDGYYFVRELATENGMGIY